MFYAVKSLIVKLTAEIGRVGQSAFEFNKFLHSNTIIILYSHVYGTSVLEMLMSHVRRAAYTLLAILNKLYTLYMQPDKIFLISIHILLVSQDFLSVR